MELITASTGSPHITVEQDSMWHQALSNEASGVFDWAEAFDAEVKTNNLIYIHSGIGMLQGRFFCINTNSYDEAVITNGDQGQYRTDLIVARWENNAMSIVVLRGTPAPNSYPSPPSWEIGSLDDGATIVDLPLWKVYINQLTISSVSPAYDLITGLTGVRSIKEGGTGSGTAATARKNLGAAPSGYGLGEILNENTLIKNPLDLNLNSGIYGLSSDVSGAVNLPEGPFLGFLEVIKYSSSFIYLKAVNFTNGHTFYNIYSGSSWSGWGILGGTNTEWFNRIPYIQSDGVMSIGKYLDFHSQDNTAIYDGRIFIDSDEMRFQCSNNNRVVIYDSSGTTTFGPKSYIGEPPSAATVQLGSTSYPFLSVYSKNGVVTTSDRRKKKDIDYDISKYEGFFKDLKACSFNFNDDEEDRKHIGFIAQDVYDSAIKNGLDKEDLSLLQIDNVTLEGKEQSSYALNYQEFIPLIIAELQKSIKKIEQLENELKALKKPAETQ